MLFDVLALSSDDDGGFQSYLFSTREDLTYSQIDCKKINSSNDILLPDQIYKELGYIRTKKFNFQEHDYKNNYRNYNDTINANNSQPISCHTGLYEEN